MKDLKKADFAETAIEFGKYVQQQWARYEDPDTLWIEYQNKMAQDVMDVLDEVSPNDKTKDANENYNERLKDSVEELEFGSIQDKINHEVQTQIGNLEIKMNKNTQGLLDVISDLYEKERFVFNEKSYEESNKEIKCYCGHTITCDCEPLNDVENEYIKSKIEEAEKSGFVEPETKQMDIADAVDLFAHFINEYPIDYKPHFNALETCIAWIKAELHDKSVSIKTQMKDGCVNYGTSEGYEDYPRTGGLK